MAPGLNSQCMSYAFSIVSVLGQRRDRNTYYYKEILKRLEKLEDCCCKECECPQGWDKLDGIPDKCYKFVGTPVTYDQAVDLCKKVRCFYIRSCYTQMLNFTLICRNTTLSWSSRKMRRKKKRSLRITETITTDFGSESRTWSRESK